MHFIIIVVYETFFLITSISPGQAQQWCFRRRLENFKNVARTSIQRKNLGSINAKKMQKNREKTKKSKKSFRHLVQLWTDGLRCCFQSSRCFLKGIQWNPHQPVATCALWTQSNILSSYFINITYAQLYLIQYKLVSKPKIE